MPPSELERIKAEAEAAERGTAGIAGPAGAAGSPSPAVQASPDQAAIDEQEISGWAQLPATFGSVLAMAMPELRDVYSDAACRQWGVAMYAVAKKHGWTVANIGPWLGLAVATVPLAVPTVLAVRIRRAAARGGEALARARDASSAAGASSGTVTDQVEGAAAASRPPRVAPVEG